VIASLATARAAPDGYTLMVGYVGTHGTNPAVRKLPYDAIKDFTPIAMVGGTPNILVVPPSLPASTLKEFVQYVKPTRASLRTVHRDPAR
jgi:tripartite-type tricarboxylate transporter receptor subunit TctC